ncbi:MAG: hypothetical protein LBM01_02590 [Christensenellaceae bacterium]|nr:hypothetical protein [Christensenellaceae bacterium]
MNEEWRKYYLREFSYHDGTHDITLNIVDIDFDRKEIKVAITDEGKISVLAFDLKSDEQGRLFFEYGIWLDEIAVNDFEKIEN